MPTRARSGSGAIAGRVGALRKGNENGARSSYDSLNGDAPPPPPLRRSQTAPVSPVEIVEAKWDYEATADDELALSVGDQISVSRQINTEWSHGRNLRTGKQGMYPVSFVIPSTQAAAKPPPPALPTTRRPLVTTPARANTTAGDTSSPFDDDAGAKTNERDEAYGQSVSELRKRLFAGQ